MSAKQKKKAKRSSRKRKVSAKLPVKVVQAVPKKPKKEPLSSTTTAVRIFERHEFTQKPKAPEIVINEAEVVGAAPQVQLSEEPAGDVSHKRHDWRVVRVVASVILVLAVLVFGFALGRMLGQLFWSHDAAGARGSRYMTEVGIETQEAEKTADVVAVAKKAATKAKELKAQREQAIVEQNRGRKLIALTFDDGPSRATTPRLLQILREKNVKATFFVVGSMLRGAPELVRQELAEGHEVGSHTTNHANLSTMDGATIRAEMLQMNQTFTELTGGKLVILRPPYGAISKAVQENTGMPLVIWSVDTLDWKYRNAATVRQSAVSASFDGAVILMHDIHATTIDAVAGIIDDLRAQGYEFMTVSELAAARGVKMQAGNTYGSFR